MPRALLTFAIPCRNAGRHLRPLLESLLRQTRQDFELVLVDDASTDDSVAVAREVCGDRLRIVENAAPLGIGGNWNRCAQLVGTPLFCLAHVDDVYEPTYAEQMCAALAAQPDAAFAHCRAHALDEDGHALDSPIERYKDGFWGRLQDPSPQAQFLLLRAGNFVMCPSIIYRAEQFMAVGPFDERLRATLDWQWNVRAALAGHPIVAVAERLMGYRRHVQSVTADNWLRLDRYREEAALLRWIDAVGRERGWLADDAPRSKALRNNILYDAFVDLRGGARGRARARLEFARREEPELAWDALGRGVAALAHTGIVGRAALGAALRLVLARARVGYFIGSLRRSRTTSRTKRA